MFVSERIVIDAPFREQLQRFQLGVRAATEGVTSLGAEVDEATLEELRRLGSVR